MRLFNFDFGGRLISISTENSVRPAVGMLLQRTPYDLRWLGEIQTLAATLTRPFRVLQHDRESRAVPWASMMLDLETKNPIASETIEQLFARRIYGKVVGPSS